MLELILIKISHERISNAQLLEIPLAYSLTNLPLFYIWNIPIHIGMRLLRYRAHCVRLLIARCAHFMVYSAGMTASSTPTIILP